MSREMSRETRIRHTLYLDESADGHLDIRLVRYTFDMWVGDVPRIVPSSARSEVLLLEPEPHWVGFPEGGLYPGLTIRLTDRDVLRFRPPRLPEQTV